MKGRSGEERKKGREEGGKQRRRLKRILTLNKGVSPFLEGGCPQKSVCSSGYDGDDAGDGNGGDDNDEMYSFLFMFL